MRFYEFLVLLEKQLGLGELLFELLEFGVFLLEFFGEALSVGCDYCLVFGVFGGYAENIYAMGFYLGLEIHCLNLQ